MTEATEATAAFDRIIGAITTDSGPPIFSWDGELQPVGLHRSRVVFDRYRVRSYLVDRDRIFREDLQTMWSGIRPKPPLEGPLMVAFAFAGKSVGPRPRDRRPQPDLSNLIKAIEDAGNGVLWADDRQIQSILAWITGWGPKVRPHVGVAIWRG